jgi:tRNA-(ms[2]io[6]A)-hydroxylase
MLKLASETPPGWAERAAANLDEILLDHAHCEKKAAGLAVTLIFQYPGHAELMAPLSALAREELAHFEEVLRQLELRGLAFGRQRPSPYPGRLRSIVSKQEPDRLLDMLLCSAVIEARSCERLGLLAEALPDPKLAGFYRGLRAAEARHHGVYVDLACSVAGRDKTLARLDEFTEHEARVIESGPTEPRLHNA